MLFPNKSRLERGWQGHGGLGESWGCVWTAFWRCLEGFAVNAKCAWDGVAHFGAGGLWAGFGGERFGWLNLWGGRSLGSLEGRVWGWEVGAAYAPLIGARRRGAVGCLATVATLKVFSA